MSIASQLLKIASIRYLSDRVD